MTATSGQRCYELSGKYSPLSSLVKMLLESSQWYSPLRRLKWVARPLYLKRTTIYIEKNSSSLSKPFVQILNVEGYSVQPFVIPACSVGAPHQRDRVWFIAQRNASNSCNARTKGMQERKAEILSSRVTTDSACSRDTAQQTYQRIEREAEVEQWAAERMANDVRTD